MEDETHMNRREKVDICLRAIVSSFGAISIENLVIRVCRENRREGLKGGLENRYSLISFALCLKP